MQHNNQAQDTSQQKIPETCHQNHLYWDIKYGTWQKKKFITCIRMQKKRNYKKKHFV
jgi:hypothetical protein